MLSFRKLLFFGCSLFLTNLASAACDYVIAPGGSDSGNGTQASPWKTINYASAKLSPGQTLCARGGTYYGQAGYIWHSSGTPTAPVTFKNFPNEKPVFDGEWGDTGTEGDFLVFSNNSNVVVDGITVQRFADQYGNGAIDLNNSNGPVDNIIIQNCTMIDNGSHTAQDHHIYIATGVTNTTIRNNLFIRAAGSAIQSYHTPASRGIRIYNNVMIGGVLNCSQSKTNPCSTTARAHWGIIIGDANDVQIYNNTIYGMQIGIDFNYGNTTSGTSFTGPYVVKNNLIVNSSEAGIRVASPYAPYFSSNYDGFYKNTNDINWKGSNMTAAAFKASTGQEANHIETDPLFVSAGSNFHLSANSPAIDKGVTLSLFKTDMDWLPRPVGFSYDIGAYEFGSAPAPAPTPTPTPVPASVKISVSQVAPGAKITVDVVDPIPDVHAWAALYLASNPDSSYSYKENWMSLNGLKTTPTSAISSATLTFIAPMEPGVYNIRLFANDGYGTRLAVSSNFTVVEPLVPVIKLATNSLSFGYVKVGKSSIVKYVNITNTGNAPLNFNSNTISGDFAFGNLGSCTATLAAGASCTYSVKFTPKVKGTRSGALVIYTNALVNNPIKITLSGTGY